LKNVHIVVANIKVIEIDLNMRQTNECNGYICNRCFDELVQSGPETNVDMFMSTSPGDTVKDRVDAFELFDEEFSLQD